MKVICIQESQRAEVLRKIHRVFQRKKRPATTPIYCRRVMIQPNNL